MPPDRPSRHSYGRAGGASVEFGLVLPILLVVLFGLIDAGWIFYNHGILVRAVRQGCRAGAVVDADGSPTTSAATAIAQLMDDWNYACPSTELCEPQVTVTSDTQGRDVLACRVSVPVASLTGLIVPVEGLSLTSATRNYVENWSSP